MKLSDYLVKFFEKNHFKYAFGVTGGGAMHLNDSFGKSKKIKFIMHHHEQAASMAAEGYSRISGKIGLCHVTTGPGGTNAITGVVGAWIDSIPMVIVSGQVAKRDMINNLQIRQRGVQEINITDIIKPIVKYSLVLKDEKKIKYELEKCLHECKKGRPGPVWIDIPLDIQAKEINEKKLISYKLSKKISPKKKFNNFVKIINLIKKAKRPSIIIGNGVHISQSEKNFLKFAKKIQIPILSSWNASDIMPTKNKNYIGRLGIFGDRASNFTIQNSDLVLILGSRLSQPLTGYRMDLFVPSGKFIMVDIDKREILKFKKKIKLGINEDLKIFIDSFVHYLKKKKILINSHKKWLNFCKNQKNKYQVILENHLDKNKVNSFNFINTLSKVIKTKTNIVTDMGTSFTCTMQTFATKNNQRLFTSSGLAAMGYGIPGSIGASFANLKSNTICITGDGGTMFNIQELQTIAHHKLPIKIFVLFNNGYLTMKLMQKKNFKNFVGSDPKSGISCPDFTKIAKAFNIKSIKISNSKNLNQKITNFLKIKGPSICQIDMPDYQPLIPRLQTKMDKNRNFLPTPIDNLFPFLSETEYKKNILY